MINNEFRLLGTVVSDYKQITDGEHAKYEIELEVDKKNGKAATYSILIYGKNRTIDFNKSIKGKRVIAFGYIDSYKNFINLILQEFVFVEVSTTEIAPNVEDNKNENQETDDDLPF